MPVTPETTPNPNAMKFTVGVPVGGPGTHVQGSDPTEVFASELLAVEGVASVFHTADFVTVSKTPESSWDQITPQVVRILESHFQG